MFCSSCGSEIQDGQAFCPTCGAPVSGTVVQPSPQAYEPAPPPILIATQQPKNSNGIAIAGFVLSLVTLFFCWLPYIPFITGLLALIFSIVGIAKKNASLKGLAIAGLVISIMTALFASLILSLGVNSYLKKAEAARESIAESSNNAKIDYINSEIDAVL